MPGLRVTGAVAVSVALLSALAGCGDAAGEDGSPDAPDVPRGDDRHVDIGVRVEPPRPRATRSCWTPPWPWTRPGRLRDRQRPADLLVFSQEPLGADVVRRIKRLDRVEAVEELSLAQVTIENRAINVAAVDPATYRRFTPRASAELQEAWERVAGGELAIDPRLGRRLADEDGLVRMGVSSDAPDIHVGALAHQIPQVDAVVNEKWGEALGMRLGNALLISTGEAAPAAVRPGHREDRRGRRVRAAARHRGPAGPGHLRAADGVPHRWLGAPTSSAPSTTPSSAAAASLPSSPG